jgi:hypothetical protein
VKPSQSYGWLGPVSLLGSLFALEACAAGAVFVPTILEAPGLGTFNQLLRALQTGGGPALLAATQKLNETPAGREQLHNAVRIAVTILNNMSKVCKEPTPGTTRMINDLLNIINTAYPGVPVK